MYKEHLQKPIPDVEILRYHGTATHPDIKIFVSHRIDLDAQTVDSPLFIPVRCGAVFDSRTDPPMLGDDTGEEISSKRLSFCELTVQYWAWKNIQADYYGLCHYRRYLSFSNHVFGNVDGNQHIPEYAISPDFQKKYGLDEASMRQVIERSDIVSLIPFDLKQDDGMFDMRVIDTIRENDRIFPEGAIDLYVKIFKEKYPDYIKDIDDYLNGHIWRAFNCFVMRRPFFEEYSQILFDILHEYEKQYDSHTASQEQMRMPGYLGEISFAIYYNHVCRTGTARTSERQLVKVLHPEAAKELSPVFGWKNVPIVLAVTSESVPAACATLHSILMHVSMDWNYDLIILEENLDAEQKQQMQAMVHKNTNCNLRFATAAPYLAISGRDLRLASLYLMHSYGNVIFLTPGLIILTNPAELYLKDLNGFPVAAAVDSANAGLCNRRYSSRRKYQQDVLRLQPETVLFDPSVLLINIPAFLSRNTLPEILKETAEAHPDWTISDVWNVSLEGRVSPLENAWNVCVHQREATFPEIDAPIELYRNYCAALNAPKILRYAEPPAVRPDVLWSSFFWAYARQTPFYEQLLQVLVQNTAASKRTSSGERFRAVCKLLTARLFPKGTRRRRAAKRLKSRLLSVLQKNKAADTESEKQC